MPVQPIYPVGYQLVPLLQKLCIPGSAGFLPSIVIIKSSSRIFKNDSRMYEWRATWLCIITFHLLTFQRDPPSWFSWPSLPVPLYRNRKDPMSTLSTCQPSNVLKSVLDISVAEIWSWSEKDWENHMEVAALRCPNFLKSNNRHM